MGQLISYTSPTGIDQLNLLDTINPQDASVAAGNLTADSVYLMRVRTKKPQTVSTMGCFIGAALGNIDMGIYTGALSGTLTRVASCGSTAAAGVNALQSIALTAAYTLQPGIDYWFAWASTGGSTTLTVGRSAAAVANVLTADATARCATKASAWSSGLPATLATFSATSFTVWVQAS